MSKGSSRISLLKGPINKFYISITMEFSEKQEI
jgi:hypothetical protein